jgi:acyl-CoA thioester hydrolase
VRALIGTTLVGASGRRDHTRFAATSSRFAGVRHHALTRHEPSQFPFRVDGRARFYETDAMGVVHHASYLGYLETARVEFLRAVGRPYGEVRERDGLDFAVIGVQLAYHAPLRFDDRFTVHTGPARARRSTFAMEYLVERAGDRIVSGVTQHAVLDATTGRPQRLPPWLAELIE